MAVAFPASELTAKIISKLVSVAADEVIRVWQLSDDLNTLRQRTELVHALIADAQSNSHRTTEAAKVWMGHLMEVARDASAFLDDLEYRAVRQQVEHHSKVRKLFSPFHRFIAAPRIAHINQSMDGIYNRGTVIGLQTQHDNSDPPLTSMERPQMPPTVDESVILGRGDDKTKIIQMLCCTKRDEKVAFAVAIVGMAGLGKTTLARMVYNDAEVQRHFGKTMWIAVSQNFTVEGILNGMLQILDQKNHQLTHLDALLKKLKELLNKSKFLLVLDDIWNKSEREWERMNDSLLGIDVQNGSKILVTTRSLQVACIMQCSTYSLGRISFEYGWMIFEQKVFSAGRAHKTKVFIDMGMRMVKRCDGVPLAINLLGGLLRNLKSECQWSLIEKSPCWLTLEKDFLPVLHISFDHLQSSSLKSCFAYCSIFPKNFVFGKSVLIQLWMALDLLHDSNTEDVGELYFNILYQNSLFQVFKVNPLLGPYHHAPHENLLFQMHDLVHDLAQDVSNKYCTTIEANKVNEVLPTIAHLRLMGACIEKIPKSFEKCLGRLETLYLEFDLCVEIFEKLKHLRILILSNREINYFPNTIGKLKHLRYIDISRTRIEALPNSISKLYLLQTLRMNYLRDLPKMFTRLISLRHIYFHDVSQSMGCFFNGINALSRLQNLPFFVVSQSKRCLLEELGGLDSLTSQLCIYGLEDVNNKDEAKKARLDNKSKILSLGFHWKVRHSDNDDYNDEDVLEGLKPHSNLEQLLIKNFKGKRLSSWMMMVNPHLRNLVKLRLLNCHQCESVPALGHLSFLEELDVVGLSSVKRFGMEFYGMTIKYNHMNLDATSCNDFVFPSLRKLNIRYLLKLEEWVDSLPVSNSSLNIFPRLEVLHIERCPMLKTVPSRFPSLKELYVENAGVEKWWCNYAFVTRVKIKECLELMKLNWGVNSNVAGFGGSTTMLVAFHFLKELTLEGLPKLVEWVEGVGDDVPLSSVSISRPNMFPFLEKLYIKCCPLLRRVSGHFPNLRILRAEGATLEMLGSNITSLISLELVRIWGRGIQLVLDELLCNCTSLTRVTIEECPEVKKLNWGLNVADAGCPNSVQFPSLKMLCLKGLPKLEESVERVGVDDPSISRANIFSCLEELDIRSCPLLRRCLSDFSSLRVLRMVDTAVEMLSSNTTSLIEMELVGIRGCGIQSVLDGLLYDCTLLTLATIEGCPELRNLNWGTKLAGGGINDSVSSPCLKRLILKDLPKLENWVGDPNGRLDIFPSLESLVIAGCPMLRRVPSHFPCLSWLDISGMNGGEGLEMMSRNVTSLRSVRLCKIGGCEIGHVADKLLRNNTCLEWLEIGDCSQLRHLPTDCLQFCTFLGGFQLYNCPALSSIPDLRGQTMLKYLKMGGYGREVEDFPWPNPSVFSLRRLVLIGWPKLKALPHPPQQLSSLTELEIEGFDGVESLPEWLGSLSNLEDLWIRHCSNLKEFPSQDAMNRLSKFQYMEIQGCGLLEERLREENGQERQKIPPFLHHVTGDDVRGMLFSASA